MMRNLRCLSSSLVTWWKRLYNKIERSIEKESSAGDTRPPVSLRRFGRSRSLLVSPLFMLQQFHTSRCSVVIHRVQHRLYFFPWHITWLFQENFRVPVRCWRLTRHLRWEFAHAHTTCFWYSVPDCQVWGKESSQGETEWGHFVFNFLPQDIVRFDLLG